MPATTKTKPETAKTASSDHVLVMYDPTPRGGRTLSESRLFCLHQIKNASGKGEFKEYSLIPGVQDLPLDVWEVWKNNSAGDIQSAIATGAIRLMSETADITAIEGFARLEIIRSTYDQELLGQWASAWSELPEEVQSALKDKDAELKSRGDEAAPVVLFGNRVG